LTDIVRGFHRAEGKASVTNKTTCSAASVEGAMKMRSIIRCRFSNMKPNKGIKHFGFDILKCVRIHTLKGQEYAATMYKVGKVSFVMKWFS